MNILAFKTHLFPGTWLRLARTSLEERRHVLASWNKVIAIKFIGLWMLAYMAYKVNPLNNPTDPRSKMSPYHPENVRLREYLMRELEGDTIYVEWPQIWTAGVTFMVALNGLVLAELIAYFR